MYKVAKEHFGAKGYSWRFDEMLTIVTKRGIELMEKMSLLLGNAR